jgi:hypothetical protein
MWPGGFAAPRRAPVHEARKRYHIAKALLHLSNAISNTNKSCAKAMKAAVLAMVPMPMQVGARPATK